MFCFKCGSALADDAKACPNCGTPVTVAPPPPLPGSIPTQVLPVAAVPQYAPAQQMPAQQMPAQQMEDKAVISLVLGILSLVSLSILAGIPAIILGKQSRKEIRASSGRLTGEGAATAGIVMGWISVGFAVLFLLFMVLMVLYLIPGG